MIHKIISLFLFIHFSIPSKTHQCIYDTQSPQPPTIVSQQYDMEHSKRSLSQSGTRFTQPIRILLNYDNLQNDSSSCYIEGQTINLLTGIGSETETYVCKSADVLGADETYLKEIMEEAREFWSGTLSVLPLSSLSLDTSLTAKESCGNVNIPAAYSTIQGVDLVVIVSARPLVSVSTLARATACQFDQFGPVLTGGRPIMSWINFGPAALAPDQLLERQEQVGITIHEMAHGLGFSFSKFQGFIQWSGINWSPIPPSTVIVNDSSGKQYIGTPTVLKAVRDHFQCETLIGAELESLGGSGTAGSHWSREQFMNEFMTGEASEFPVYSQITLAIFQDMGWYGIYNNTLVEPLIWGWHRGCQFTNSCTNWPNTLQDSGYSCDQTSPINQCTFDLKSVGICSVYDLLSDPLLLPNCHYYETTDSLRCDNPHRTGEELDDGEVNNKSSRCFVSNILKNTDDVNLSGSQSIYKCYATACESENQLKVSVDNIWYDCPYSGGEVQPLSFSGSIQCLPKAADRVCLGQPLDPNWPKFYSLSPTSGPPGIVITILGDNFNKTPMVSVSLYAPCTTIRINNTHLTCTLADVDSFSGLNIFQSFSGPTSLSVVITDGVGRTALGKNAFMLDVDPGAGFLMLIKQQPGWGVLIFGVIGLLLLCLVIAFIGCCCGERKEERSRSSEWDEGEVMEHEGDQHNNLLTRENY